jgi:N6-adenosine-specific RNA methylase IME4
MNPKPNPKLHLIPVESITVPTERMRKLRPDLVGSLVESISARGLLQPIVVWPRGAGLCRHYRLVAGRHRLEAVRKLQHESIRAVILDGADADEALLVEIDENLIHGDLSPAERALHHAERKRLYEKLHPETKHGGDRRSGGFQVLTNENLKSYAAAAAKKTGKGRSTVARDVARASKVVVLRDIIGTPLDEGDQIDALAKLPEDEQRKLAEQAKAGEEVTAKHVAQKPRREESERELAAATEAASQTLGRNVYGVLYIDPPWRFEVHAQSGMDRCADSHYPTMTTESIAALKIPAADDAVLFLWSTPPMQPHALHVMAAWGFTYKSLVVWDKGINGIGYWVRGRVEILLIGTRGNVPAPLPSEQPPQLITAPRRRHSEKPDIFAEHIERLYPNTPKLEMFARRARSGWDVWGNEAPPPHIPDDLSIPNFLRRTTEAGE